MNQLTITKKIAYTSLLSAIAVVMNIFTLPNTPLGTVSFVYVPCFLSGILLGPVLGFVVGFVGDLIGCIIAPKGAISILILLSSGLLGMICGFVFRVVKSENLVVKMLVVYFSVLIICTFGFSSAGNYIVTGFLQNKYMTFWNYLLISRLPTQPFVLMLNSVLTYSILKLILKQKSFRMIMISSNLNVG